MAFFATAGGGTEVFVAKELSDKGIDCDAIVTQGKVYFRCDETSFKKLFQLKTVERVFVQIEHFKTPDIMTKDVNCFRKRLCERLVSKIKLENCLSIFRQVKQHEVVMPEKYVIVKKIRYKESKWLQKKKKNWEKRKLRQAGGERVTETHCDDVDVKHETEDKLEVSLQDDFKESIVKEESEDDEKDDKPDNEQDDKEDDDDVDERHEPVRKKAKLFEDNGNDEEHDKEYDNKDDKKYYKGDNEEYYKADDKKVDNKYDKGDVEGDDKVDDTKYDKGDKYDNDKKGDTKYDKGHVERDDKEVIEYDDKGDDDVGDNGDGEGDDKNCDKEDNEGDGEGYEPARKKVKLSENADVVTFRINCKIAGYWLKASKGNKKKPNTIRNPFSCWIGKSIADLLKWQTDMRHADLDICVFINDDVVSAGVPVTKIPVSLRSYSHIPGLRYPLAWIIGSLANIQEGDLVLDPMCGKGTILIEVATEIKTALYLGMDADPGQLIIAVQNLAASRTESSIHLFQGNVIYLPLKENSVDKIVCDAPFGKQYSGKQYSAKGNLNNFYPLFLKEMYRVLKPNGTAVVMTGASLKGMFLSCIQSTELHEQPVNTGAENSLETADVDASRPQLQTDDMEKLAKIPFVKSAEYFMKLGKAEACIFVLKSKKES